MACAERENREEFALSVATRLQSFLALRKLDDFLGGVKPKPDDLVASNLGINVPSVLGDVGERFLTTTERENINKGVAHLTERLSLDPDSEVDLKVILNRSMAVFARLISENRTAETSQDAAFWLHRTGLLIERAQALYPMKMTPQITFNGSDSSDAARAQLLVK